MRLLVDDPQGKQRESYDNSTLLSEYEAAFDEIQASACDELQVAELDGEIVGTMHLTFIRYLTYRGGLRMQIEAVRVDESRRGHGLGEAMMLWALSRARERGCHLVQLTTNKNRNRAHRFYERIGFVASHEGMKLHFTP